MHCRSTLDEADKLEVKATVSGVTPGEAAAAQLRTVEILAGAIRFGFRVHQFVGGFNSECAAAFERLLERDTAVGAAGAESSA